MTPLEDGESGIRLFIEMFGKSLVAAVPAEELPAILSEFEREVRPRLYHQGAWSADYRRIRVLAVRQG